MSIKVIAENNTIKTFKKSDLNYIVLKKETTPFKTFSLKAKFNQSDNIYTIFNTETNKELKACKIFLSFVYFPTIVINRHIINIKNVNDLNIESKNGNKYSLIVEFKDKTNLILKPKRYPKQYIEIVDQWMKIKKKQKESKQTSDFDLTK